MLEIFQYDFMIRAFVAGLAVALIAPTIGLFLVVRRYSLMADTLAHVSLAGVAIGLLLNLPPVLTAVVTATLASFAIEKLRQAKQLYGESVLALFLSGSLAIATVLISLAHGFTANLFSYLFGSITTVSTTDVVTVLSLGLLVAALTALLYRQFFLVSLGEELAQASGLPVKLLNFTLVFLAAITVSLAMRIVGILLVGALMVIPVLTAIQLRRGFAQTLAFAILFSLLSVTLGLFASFYLDLASGGTIVLIALIFFCLTLLSGGQVIPVNARNRS